ncbi:MAG: prolyl oligopeptidase family serine peptidase [Gammaproteobacteria bacterium]|jgi:dipeptidyl aminopeptidase/acylaminoacyl peptidase|nr:prolyl oligopeptidase family serine peptidase [Gammaproteobacteria bacterium]
MKKLLLGLILLLPTLALAQDDNGEDDRKVLSADVLWELDRIGSPVISSDGDWIVAPVTDYDVEEDTGETRLWLFAADGSVERPLTVEGQDASSPAFSPEGDRLAFVAKRGDDEAGQIYVLSMDGPGEAQKLSDVPTGVGGIKWAGEHIYFVSSVYPEMNWEEMAEKLEEEKDSKVTAHQWNALPYSSWDHWLDEDRQNHVFRIPADGGDVEPVTQPLDRQLSRSGAGAGSYDIHPDETHIAFVSDRKGDGVDPDYDVYLGEIGADSADNLAADNEASDSTPMFSPDGETLAYLQQDIAGFYGDTQDIVLVDLDSGEQRNITESWDRSASGLVWAPDSSGFYGSIDDAGTVRVFFIDGQGRQPRAITGETSYGDLAIAGNGTLVGTNQSFLYPPRLVSIDTDSGEATRLSTLNKALLDSVDAGSYESVTYTGHDGADIQMWVNYPPGFDDSKEYPLFLLIHGGPHGSINDVFHFRWNAQTFASWGYVTAWHNFHGSSGFGQEFVDYINPDWLTAPYNDTIAAAEWFADKDWIDSERMVAGGGSYGGYLSSILLGKPHPFNALMIHAPVYNMYSQMAADFAVHANRFGHFWEVPEIYEQISPHYYAGEFDTPALIIHGQNDLRVPVGQAFELFRTLQSRDIESRLIYFPDENHWVLKPNNSLYWYEEVRKWFADFAEPGAQ